MFIVQHFEDKNITHKFIPTNRKVQNSGSVHISNLLLYKIHRANSHLIILDFFPQSHKDLAS